jgi:hypothetical protein
MKLGTVVYDNKIYNLDYMTVEEMKNLLKKIEEDKSNNFTQGENVVNG